MPTDPPSRKRPLTAEEADLWLFAMRQAKALKRRDRERRKTEAREAAADDAVAPAENSPPAQTPRSQAATPPQPAPEMRTSAAQANKFGPPPLSTFDERQRRRLAKDASLIDARLDLHGMRQREAYGVLTSFLRASAARGLRHVLVITGKGAPEPERTRDFYTEERGVLRRLVPIWLAEPELRGLVVSYTTSHVRHGGEGALYIRLRKNAGDRHS